MNNLGKSWKTYLHGKAVFRISSNIYDGTFAKIVNGQRPWKEVTILVKSSAINVFQDLKYSYAKADCFSMIKINSLVTL